MTPKPSVSCLAPPGVSGPSRASSDQTYGTVYPTEVNLCVFVVQCFDLTACSDAPVSRRPRGHSHSFSPETPTHNVKQMVTTFFLEFVFYIWRSSSSRLSGPTRSQQQERVGNIQARGGACRAAGGVRSLSHVGNVTNTTTCSFSCCFLTWTFHQRGCRKRSRKMSGAVDQTFALSPSAPLDYFRTMCGQSNLVLTSDHKWSELSSGLRRVLRSKHSNHIWRRSVTHVATFFSQ